MTKGTEIVREVRVGETVMHVHIHLSDEEIRRLLLPHIAQSFSNGLITYRTNYYATNEASTTALFSKGKEAEEA